MEQWVPAEQGAGCLGCCGDPHSSPAEDQDTALGLLGMLAADGPLPETALCQRALAPRTVPLSKGSLDLRLTPLALTGDSFRGPAQPQVSPGGPALLQHVASQHLPLPHHLPFPVLPRSNTLLSNCSLDGLLHDESP